MFLLIFTRSSKRPQEKESAPSPSITLQRTPKPSHKRTLSQSSTTVPNSKDSSKSSSKRRKGEDKPLRRDAKVRLILCICRTLFSHTGLIWTFSAWVSVLYLKKVHTLFCGMPAVLTVYTSRVKLYTWNIRGDFWLPSCLCLIHRAEQKRLFDDFKYEDKFMTFLQFGKHLWVISKEVQN